MKRRLLPTNPNNEVGPDLNSGEGGTSIQMDIMLEYGP